MTDSGPGPGAASDITAANPFLGNRLGTAAAPAVVGVEIREQVEVSFSDSSRRSFHHQWLRHCCYCEQCGNPADGIRFTTVLSFDADIVPAAAAVEHGELRIIWPDGHRSAFAADWLISNSYERDDRERRASWRPTLWRSAITADFPCVAWPEVVEGQPGQLRMLELLLEFGIVQVTGIGTDPAGTEQLASHLGPIHETTVYGRIYDVRAEPVAKLGAKTGMAQAPHTDDAFSYCQPGIDVFHCLVNTDEGGLSTYVDGFAIADDLRRTAPDAYAVLTSVAVAHIRRHPGEIELRNRAPLISVDEFGEPCGIRYFDRALAPVDTEPDLIDAVFDALRAYSERMVSADFRAEIRVAPGDAVLIDNHRVQHGRTAFDPASGRHIRLCHVPRDEVHGRLRELRRRFDPDAHDLYLPQGSGLSSAASVRRH